VFSFACTKCHYAMKFDDADAGRLVVCPNCGTRLRLPALPFPARAPARGREPDDTPVAAEDELPVRRGRRRAKRGEVRDEPEAGVAEPTPEWVEPAVLLGIGLLLAVGGVFVAGGAAALLLSVVLRLAITVPISVVGMFVAAKMLGISFGTLGLAILKLAAISVFTLGIVATGDMTGWPVAGILIAIPVGWLLFSRLFDLDFLETLWSLVIIGVIQWLAGLLFAQVAQRLGG
jgi:hypothetical protein